jgi:hypothetical protein
MTTVRASSRTIASSSAKTARFECASSPVVGSSSTSTCGCHAIARSSASFVFAPKESVAILSPGLRLKVSISRAA